MRNGFGTGMLWHLTLVICNHEINVGTVAFDTPVSVRRCGPPPSVFGGSALSLDGSLFWDRIYPTSSGGPIPSNSKYFWKVKQVVGWTLGEDSRQEFLLCSISQGVLPGGCSAAACLMRPLSMVG